MPGSASSWTHRPEDLITRLRSASSFSSSNTTEENGEAKLKVLRELKNQIIGNRTKKLSYIKLGAVPSVVSILSHAVASQQQRQQQSDYEVDSLLVQSAAAIGSFACGVDLGVKAVLDAGAFTHLLRLISHPNDKVVDAGARSLKIIYQSELAPKYDFLEEKNMGFLLSLLNSENDNVTELGASIITHSCQTSIEQKALSDAGVLKKLLCLLEGSVSRRDASLESLATIVKGNPEIISEFVGLENGRTMSTITELTKDKFPRTRLLACVVLIVIRNSSPLYFQSVGIKTKLILILLELLDDPNQVGDEAAFALSSFIGEEEDLQKLAFEANVIDKLCDHLQKDSLQAKRLQGIYLALAGLCSTLECCRSTLLKSPKALKFITDALTHDAAEVRAAASICLRNISRSVKHLSAGHFMSENILNPLIQLLYDTSTAVQIAALGAISNIVVDFTMHKSTFIQCGGVKQLVQLSKSMDSTVRLNAVWALRNLMFLVDGRCKVGIYLELTASTLTSLISDPKPSVQEQALALVRNLVDGPVDSIEYVLAEDGLLLHTVGRQLRSASKPEVLIQGMYVLCNVASGTEFHKDAVMDQLLPQSASGNQPFMITILQNNDSRLRTAAVWTLVNLTSPIHTGAFARVMKLRKAGIFSQLKSMGNDPCLDVKLRARTAIGQSLTFGDGST